MIGFDDERAKEEYERTMLEIEQFRVALDDFAEALLESFQRFMGTLLELGHKFQAALEAAGFKFGPNGIEFNGELWRQGEHPRPGVQKSRYQVFIKPVRLPDPVRAGRTQRWRK